MTEPVFAFDNTYAGLPERFFASMGPTPVAAPKLIRINTPLAEALGVEPAALASAEGVEALAGNRPLTGAAPLAQAYAGHQFGGWSGQLGDGRAILLGEVVGAMGRRDIQLKGAGPTPYSRMGDGRAPLGPVLREYIVSEAMAALGVPTSRALAAVETGETALREDGPLPGAVLTRVAASHIRVGTFEFFRAKRDEEALRLLTDHALARHYPDAEAETPALALLESVIEAQAALIAQWMGLGFIHGVMNTDNMTISGETIDYGPCAFMDGYDPARVFSSIDQFGRYAYANQPSIAHWNLSRLAIALMPLLAAEEDEAVGIAQAALDRFPALYEAERRAVFGRKLGLAAAGPEDDALIERLLSAMAEENADFTGVFRALAASTERDAPIRAALGVDTDWLSDWRARLAGEADPKGVIAAANPLYIPRNHLVEEAIAAGYAGDYAPFETLLEVLARPFDEQPGRERYAAPPAKGQEVLQTFCGT